MRAHATVLQIALLVALPALPGAVDAQQRDADAPATDGAAEPPAPKPARRSLMGEVMATLIENAEHSQQREAAPAAKPPATAIASAPAEPATAERPQGPQVAAQTPP
jgi:hypothetical protein